MRAVYERPLPDVHTPFAAQCRKLAAAFAERRALDAAAELVASTDAEQAAARAAEPKAKAARRSGGDAAQATSPRAVTVPAPDADEGRDASPAANGDGGPASLTRTESRKHGARLHE